MKYVRMLQEACDTSGREIGSRGVGEWSVTIPMGTVVSQTPRGRPGYELSAPWPRRRAEPARSKKGVLRPGRSKSRSTTIPRFRSPAPESLPRETSSRRSPLEIAVWVVAAMILVAAGALAVSLGTSGSGGGPSNAPPTSAQAAAPTTPHGTPGRQRQWPVDVSWDLEYHHDDHHDRRPTRAGLP